MDKHRWSIIALVVVIAAIAVYLLTAPPELVAALKHVTLTAALVLLVLRLLFLATNGLFLREFASRFGVQLRPKEWMGLSVVTTMGNYITPFSGGMVARAAYLKRRHAFPYAQFATLLASNYLVNFWVVGVVGVFTLLTFGETIGLYWQVFAFFATVVISISALVIFPSFRLPWRNRVTQVMNTSLRGWGIVKSDPSLMARLVSYALFNILLTAFSFWVAYDALGSRVSFRAALLIGLLTSFSLLIKVTPGNLGIQETAISLSSGLLGIGIGQGLLVALLIRAATLLLLFTLGPIFSFLLTRELAVSQPAANAPASNAGNRDDGQSA
jgi:uncharacterized membrane protein YbhN (UPF0104 family)